MKAQQVIDYLPKDEIKEEVLKSKNLFIKLILKPLLDKLILIIIESVLKRFNLSPKTIS